MILTQKSRIPYDKTKTSLNPNILSFFTPPTKKSGTTHGSFPTTPHFLCRVTFSLYARFKVEIHGPSRVTPHIPPAKRARSRTLQQIRTSQNDKNFPQAHPPNTKRIKSSLCPGGCAWGKFSEEEGGLEGEGASFKRTPSPSKVFPPISLRTKRVNRKNRRRR